VNQILNAGLETSGYEKKFNVQNIWRPLSNRVKILVVTRKRLWRF